MTANVGNDSPYVSESPVDIEILSDKHPDHTSVLILCRPGIQSLIGQFMIDQHGSDVDFGEHGRRMAWLCRECTV